MKKLNKQQKQFLKSSLIKGVNITCYVIAGLSLTLGVIVGVKSCSDKKKQNVATTPVVSEVLSRKDRATIQNSSTGYLKTKAETDYMRYIDGATYYVDGRSYNDWTTWGSLAGQTLISYDYPSGVDSNTPGYIANPITIRQWNRDGYYTPVECYRLRFGSNNQLRAYRRGVSSYTTIDPTANASALSGVYELYLDFTTPSCDVNIDILPNQNGQDKPKVFYDFLTSHIDAELEQSDSWLSYSYSGDGLRFNMGDYISPYGVYGYFDATNSKLKPTGYCIFDGEFTLGEDTYTNVFVQNIGHTIQSEFAGAPANEVILKEIVYYNRFTDDSLIVAQSNYNTLPGVGSVSNPDWWNNNVRWAWVNYMYKSIMVKQANSGYASIFEYSDNNGDAYWGLNQTFSGDYNQFTSAPGTIDNISVPSYSGDDASSVPWNSVFGLLSSAFSSVASVFNFYILPGVSIGTLLFLPLVVSIVIFIIWLIKR